FRKNAKIADEETFDSLRAHVHNLMIQAGIDITSGDIHLNPFQYKQNIACTYCPFRSVCQFEPTLESNQYHRLKDMKDEEILVQLRKDKSGMGDTIVKWTKEQESAIYTEGSDILVSAAAGSGKTAVLVERIIQKLLKKDNPVDIDSLLVVTFTNAAAQEMRARVGLALEEALAKDPTSLHLKKQLSLLQRASISTLHSFCLDILREYAYLIDLDPGFRIANDVENDQIKQDVIEDLFEEW